MGRTDAILGKFPSFYSSTDEPSVLRRFLSAFGEVLDEADADLYTVMRAHWVDTADNAGSQGFNTAVKGDLDRIFSLYLENLGGTSQLKQAGRREGADDDLYRQRILGLISVLQHGASTRDGIIAIVAANLGIVGDSPPAVDARNQIRVVEYLPAVAQAESHGVAFHQAFQLFNPNVTAEHPEIRITIRDEFSATLANPRLANGGSGIEARYSGFMRSGDVLALFSDGTALLNGASVALQGNRIELPPGYSTWRFEAEAVTPEKGIVPIGAFDAPGGPFDAAAFSSERVADISMTLKTTTPGSFTVCIPWDIPGFTEKLDELPDQPRNQIQYIVNKVRAAGVFSVIAYEKTLTDPKAPDGPEMLDALTLRIPRYEDGTLQEANFDIGSVQFPEGAGVVHDMTDRLTLSGVFDFTGFDTLNTFS